MRPAEFMRRHNLTTSLGVAAYFGIAGYVVPALDTGLWNPREQWAYTQKYNEAYLRFNEARHPFADPNNDHMLSNDEIKTMRDLDKKLGIKLEIRPPIEDLEKATKAYQDELKKREKR